MPTPVPTETTFQIDSERVLGGVRSAVVSLLAALPTTPVKAADVARALELDAKLGWQLFRIAGAPTALDAGAHVPGPTGVQRVLRAARERELPEPVVESAARAFIEFDRLVSRHAGDRRGFEALITSCLDDGQEASQTSNRRALYRGSSHLYGLAAATQFGCVVFHPGAAPGTMDQVMLRGFVDLEWYRTHQSFILSRWRRNIAPADHPDGVTRAPLDPAGAELFGGPLLPEFTTDPNPVLRTREVETGHYVTELVGRCVGRGSAATYVLGERMSGLRIGDGAGVVQEMVAFVRAPVRTLLLDILVPPGLAGPLETTTEVLGDPSGEAFLQADPWKAREHAMRLPVPAEVRLAGRAPTALQDPNVPRYTELVRSACETMGWDWTDLDVFRLKIQFPPLHSCIFTSLQRAGSGG